jgi:hypothetical protein
MEPLCALIGPQITSTCHSATKGGYYHERYAGGRVGGSLFNARHAAFVVVGVHFRVRPSANRVLEILNFVR